MLALGVKQVTGFAQAPVAPLGVEALGVLADPRQQALVDILTVCEIHPLKSFGTLHLSVCNHRVRWFDGALLAFVETPGSTHTSTAIILFG